MPEIGESGYTQLRLLCHALLESLRNRDGVKGNPGGIQAHQTRAMESVLQGDHMAFLLSIRLAAYVVSER